MDDFSALGNFIADSGEIKLLSKKVALSMWNNPRLFLGIITDAILHKDNYKRKFASDVVAATKAYFVTHEKRFRRWHDLDISHVLSGDRASFLAAIHPFLNQIDQETLDFITCREFGYEFYLFVKDVDSYKSGYQIENSRRDFKELASSFQESIFAEVEGLIPKVGKFWMEKEEFALLDEAIEYTSLRIVTLPTGMILSLINEGNHGYSVVSITKEFESTSILFGVNVCLLLNILQLALWRDLCVVYIDEYDDETPSRTRKRRQPRPSKNDSKRTLYFPRRRVRRRSWTTKTEKDEVEHVLSKWPPHYRYIYPNRASSLAHEKARLHGWPIPPPKYTFVSQRGALAASVSKIKCTGLLRAKAFLDNRIKIS